LILVKTLVCGFKMLELIPEIS